MIKKCWEIASCSSDKSKGCPAMKSGKSCWTIRKCSSCFPGGKQSCPVFKQHNSDVLLLVKNAQAGSQEAVEDLIKEYSRFVFQMEKKYFIPGSNREDLFQEGFIGLYTAIKTYDSGRNLPFEDYVSLCIRNAVIRAIRTATQKKQLLLTHAGSIDDDANSFNSLKSFMDTEDIVLGKLKVEQLRNVINSYLSSNEKTIIKLRLADFTVEEIAGIISEDKKKVENALYRARKKIKSFIFPKTDFSRGKSYTNRASLIYPVEKCLSTIGVTV
jgi:RNA polymerase sporulation-specific sigma factor